MNSETIAVRSDTAAPNSCVRCKKPLEPNSYRRCDDCRAKMRQYYQKSKLKANQAAAQLQAIENVQPAFSPENGESLPTSATKVKKRKPQDKSTSTKKKQKRMDTLKTSEKEYAGLVSPDPIKAVWSIVQSRIENNTEYITASALYEALKDASSARPFHFRGGYSIVCVTGVDHNGRAQAVVRELAKVPGLSFNPDRPNSNGDAPDHSFFSLFRCICDNINKPKAPSATSTTFRLPTCPGVVRIFVKSDSTYPIRGIVGQRVEVEVRHP